MAEQPQAAAKINPENFLSNVPKEKIRRPFSFYERFILDVLVFLSALGVGYSYKSFLDNQNSYLLLAAALFLFFIFSALEIILNRNFRRRLLVLVLETIALTVFFYSYPVNFFAPAFFLILIFLIWGEMAGHAELKNNLRVRFFKVINNQFKKTITALSLAAVILYLPQLSDTNIFLSPDSFGAIFSWSSSIIKDFYPQLNLDSSAKDLAKSIALAEAQKNFSFHNLPPSEQEKILNQAAGQVLGNLEKNLGITIVSDAPVRETLYDFFLKMIKNWREKFSDWFTAAWFLIVFSTIRSFGVVFYWLAALLSYVSYRLLLEFGILQIKAENSMQEAVEFSQI